MQEYDIQFHYRQHQGNLQIPKYTGDYHNTCTAVAEMGNHLATIDMG